MPPVRLSPQAALVVAWAGAGLFVASLLYFLYSYLIRFGQTGAPGQAARAAAVNVLLFSVFALHHSLLARSGMKARMHRLVPPELERATYTWTASVLFILVCWWWRPLPGEFYRLDGLAAIAAYAVQALGGAIAVRSSARLDVLDLAGVRPVLGSAADGRGGAPALVTDGLYGIVRHPLYLGWMLLVFGAPHMTMTRFTFATVSTLYLAVAVPFEERSLIRAFGPAYRAYRERVRWRFVPGLY